MQETFTWSNRKQEAPKRSAVYAIYSLERCLYVGATRNLKNRLSGQHHKLQGLATLPIETIHVVYWLTEPKKLRSLEKARIREFNPVWNGRLWKLPTGVQRRFLLTLEDELHLATKVRAIQEGITLGTLIKRAILAYLGNEGGAPRRQKKTARRKD